VLEHLAGDDQRVAPALGGRRAAHVAEHESLIGQRALHQRQRLRVHVEAGHAAHLHEPGVQQRSARQQLGGVRAVGTAEMGDLPRRLRAQVLKPRRAVGDEGHPQPLAAVHLGRTGRLRPGGRAH